MLGHLLRKVQHLLEKEAVIYSDEDHTTTTYSDSTRICIQILGVYKQVSTKYQEP
jgi:hypothetical protein